MEEFIKSLNITDISSEGAELKGLYCESMNDQCECNCPDGCDGTDDDA